MATFSFMAVMMAVSLAAVLLNDGSEAAPAERGFLSFFHAPERSQNSPNFAAEQETMDWSPNYLSGRLRTWLLAAMPTASAKAMANAIAMANAKVMATATARGGLVRAPRSSREMSSPDKSIQILRMISRLDELYRTINGTLSRRIAFMPRANGRTSAKKNKVVPAPEAVLKLTTAPPMETVGTAPRASTDNVIPSMTGRSSKKSNPPPKKSNKRVCFWKYCSQN
ncbi:urotensin II-related peptide [Gadus morhua]|uniref:Uncharacterized protein n=1 Tax=Gadus morhua TaxID=8049 RepID=A0A8C5A8Q9_GADMO|nr:uncharacterized protein LOC115547609 [Gadus morhua]